MGKITEAIKKYAPKTPIDVAKSAYGLGKDIVAQGKSAWKGKVLRDKLKQVQRDKKNKENEPQVFKRTQEDLKGWTR